MEVAFHLLFPCSLFIISPFLNSAFEDETTRLRQLKLDNQVSPLLWPEHGAGGLDADVWQGLGKKTVRRCL